MCKTANLEPQKAESKGGTDFRTIILMDLHFDHVDSILKEVVMLPPLDPDPNYFEESLSHWQYMATSRWWIFPRAIIWEYAPKEFSQRVQQAIFQEKKDFR